MTSTTIKIESSVRDRLNAAARDRGLTAGSFVEELLELYLREQRFAAIREAMASRPAIDLAYSDEIAEWDAASEDGLDPEDRVDAAALPPRT